MAIKSSPQKSIILPSDRNIGGVRYDSEGLKTVQNGTQKFTEESRKYSNNFFYPNKPGSFDVLSIPTLKGWYDGSDASTITIATGVSQWRDKSGLANHLNQGTPANQPGYSGGWVTFPTNTPFMNLTANWPTGPAGGDTTTMLVVLQRVAGAGYAVPLSNGSNKYPLSADAGANQIAGANVFGQWSKNPHVIDTGPHLYNISCLENTSWTVRVDRTDQVIVTPFFNFPVNTLLGYGDASAANWKIGELILIGPTALGTLQTYAESYLRSKWGTP